MNKELLKVGVVVPRSPLFDLFKEEQAVTGALTSSGLATQGFTLEPTTHYEQTMQSIDGLVVGAITPNNYSQWPAIETNGYQAAWDRVVLNGIITATKLRKPVFSSLPKEQVGYFSFLLHSIKPINEVEATTGFGQMPTAAEIIPFGDDTTIIIDRLSSVSN
ncbi:MAG TPA: hypothetical protein VK712_00535 [Verrucomicrobiae bacterium]|jgi:hypothetical protein|nr:hypothetical protein [Verrucomicrobiae bacterium]